MSTATSKATSEAATCWRRHLSSWTKSISHHHVHLSFWQTLCTKGFSNYILLLWLLLLCEQVFNQIKVLLFNIICLYTIQHDHRPVAIMRLLIIVFVLLSVRSSQDLRTLCIWINWCKIQITGWSVPTSHVPRRHSDLNSITAEVILWRCTMANYWVEDPIRLARCLKIAMVY